MAREPILVVDPETHMPEEFIIPCDSSAVAMLAVDEPVRLYCNKVLGHDGQHVFYMVWDTPEN